MGQIVETFDALPFEPGKPSAIVAQTIKGKGVSFIETLHMARLDPKKLQAALAELGEPGLCGGGEEVACG
jgi:transketolase